MTYASKISNVVRGRNCANSHENDSMEGSVEGIFEIVFHRWNFKKIIQKKSSRYVIFN